MLQQRYHSDKGWITVHQEGTVPAAGEPVFLEGDAPAPDGVYLFPSDDQHRYIEVKEGLVHFYFHRRRETDIGTGNVFILFLLFVVLLFILFRVMGRH